MTSVIGLRNIGGSGTLAGTVARGFIGTTVGAGNSGCVLWPCKSSLLLQHTAH